MGALPSTRTTASHLARDESIRSPFPSCRHGIRRIPGRISMKRKGSRIVASSGTMCRPRLLKHKAICPPWQSLVPIERPRDSGEATNPERALSLPPSVKRAHGSSYRILMGSGRLETVAVRFTEPGGVISCWDFVAFIRKGGQGRRPGK